jgi:hypothetical protein
VCVSVRVLSECVRDVAQLLRVLSSFARVRSILSAAFSIIADRVVNDECLCEVGHNDAAPQLLRCSLGYNAYASTSSSLRNENGSNAYPSAWKNLFCRRVSKKAGQRRISTEKT